MRVIRQLAVAAGAATAGLVLAMPAAGYADGVTGGNAGVGNGNQVQAPVQAPVNVCGNGIGAVGTGKGKCVGGHATAENPGCPTSSSYDWHKGWRGDGWRDCPHAWSPTPSPSEPQSPPASSPAPEQPSVSTTPVSNNSPILPVTGSSLTILVLSALVLVIGGAAVMFLARRRRA